MSDILGPIITEMVNLSFEQGRFPDSQKHAIVVPRIKKPSLDPSYRPVSNITFISKLVERIAASRFNSHAGLFKLLPARQSAYRRFHSTETAVAIVHNNIVRATDSGQVSALVLLYLSAAFDTVDHGTLLEILSLRFGITSSVLEWFLNPTSLVEHKLRLYHLTPLLRFHFSAVFHNDRWSVHCFLLRIQGTLRRLLMSVL